MRKASGFGLLFTNRTKSSISGLTAAQEKPIFGWKREGIIRKGLIIAGTHSGVGKTTITLGVMAALKRRGLSVAPFKVGPDFIDPSHHTRITGRHSRNLDGWMLNQAYNRRCFIRHSAGADVAVVEGVMGLFDGFSGTDEAGSTAQMAKWLNLPILLVVDAASMARSAAALVQGFQRFDPDVRFAGVVFNNLGSAGHLQYIKEALAANVDIAFLGGLLRNEILKLPERHLGLVTAWERPHSGEHVNLLAEQTETGLNLDQLLQSLHHIPDPSHNDLTVETAGERTARLGVAMDRAFCFYYQDNIDMLTAAGVEVVPFSPLNDQRLPGDLDGIYLGGGYPELYARQLAQNRTLREMIRQCSRKGMPIYGECGGFMYLCRELEDLRGNIHHMCNCFPFRSRMHSKLEVLGYRRIRLTDDTLLGKKNDALRGHEFHYSKLVSSNQPSRVQTRYRIEGRRADGEKQEGYGIDQTLGSYVHLHFGSRPESAEAFARACRAYRETK